MFYDKDLMCSKSLGKVWRAGHGLSEELDEESSMASICDKLDSWVDSHHEDARRRLSLRSSSIFVDGAARLYKRKLEVLYEDTQRLDLEISRRKRFRSSINEYNISQTFTDPEYQDTSNFDFLEPNQEQTESSEFNASHIDYVESNSDSSNASKNIDAVQKCDKGVQTTPKKRRNRTLRFEQNLPYEGFDQNLPFGFVMVHENYHSRIPTKIIFSSLSPDVRKLV